MFTLLAMLVTGLAQITNSYGSANLCHTGRLATGNTGQQAAILTHCEAQLFMQYIALSTCLTTASPNSHEQWQLLLA